VSDGSLAVLVAEVRRALGDAAPQPLYVRTVNRFGYAFVGSTAVAAAEPHTHSVSAAHGTLTWGAERARLKPGDNVIGRDPDADICIDAVTLRDLSSKNGTFADGVRVTSAVTLPAGAEIKLGALCLRFHRIGPTPPTQTVRHT
jgi:hypothetical protein